jgi:hypothetical protein
MYHDAKNPLRERLQREQRKYRSARLFRRRIRLVCGMNKEPSGVG